MKPVIDDLELAAVDRLIADELMERFVAGEDVMPDRYMELARSHDIAMAKARRYAQWGHACSVLLGEIARSTSAVPK